MKKKIHHQKFKTSSVLLARKNRRHRRRGTKLDTIDFNAPISHPEHNYRPIPAQGDEKIKKIAQDIVHNLIFTDHHYRNQQEQIELLGMTFMPIIFGGLSDVDPNDLGMIYEYMDKALPRSINGYPCFMSCRVMNKPDTKKVFELVVKMQKALEDVT
jgi:hypothetical protein